MYKKEQEQYITQNQENDQKNKQSGKKQGHEGTTTTQGKKLNKAQLKNNTTHKKIANRRTDIQNRIKFNLLILIIVYSQYTRSSTLSWTCINPHYYYYYIADYFELRHPFFFSPLYAYESYCMLLVDAVVSCIKTPIGGALTH